MQYAILVGTLLCLSLVAGSRLYGADEPSLHTYTYKKVGDLEIKADVHQFADEQVRPGVVWIHGGALINGHRAGVSNRIRRMALEQGYVLVSIDYRLAPETKLPAIIEDVEDAFRWIRSEGPKLFHVDPKRIAVCGGSAGGYLALTSGFRAEPRPQVVLSLWGYGDLVGDWYSRASPHPRHNQVQTTREQAWKQVSGPPISDARERKGDGGMFYQYCRQQGAWPQAVSGWDPHTEAERFFPYMAVKNIDTRYPPTVLVHGTADTDVPHEQSVMVARELQAHNVEHELFSIPGGEHGLAGGDPQQIEEAYRRALDFVIQRLSAEP